MGKRRSWKRWLYREEPCEEDQIFEHFKSLARRDPDSAKIKAAAWIGGQPSDIAKQRVLLRMQSIFPELTG